MRLVCGASPSILLRIVMNFAVLFRNFNGGWSGTCLFQKKLLKNPLLVFLAHIEEDFLTLVYIGS